MEEREETLQTKEEDDIKVIIPGKRKNEVLMEQESSRNLLLAQNAGRPEEPFLGMHFPQVLKGNLRNKQESVSVKEPATLSSSTSQFVPWQFDPQKRTGVSAQMAKTKCTGKEYAPLEMLYGNRTPNMGAECDDTEVIRHLKALKSCILNEKGDPKVQRTDSISRTKNLDDRKIYGINNSTAILLSHIGKDHTAELTEARTIRQSGGKDRHSKVVTSKGPRDRRVRLSVSTAVQFYEVLDRLGYDQPSKAIEWLIKEAKSAIDELARLPDLCLQKFNSVDRASGGNVSRTQRKPILDAADYGSCRTTYFSCCNDRTNLKGSRMSGMNSTPEEGGIESGRTSESINDQFATQGHKNLSEKQLRFGDPHDLSSIFMEAVEYWSSLRDEIKNRAPAPSLECAEFQQAVKDGERKKAAANGSNVVANLQQYVIQPDQSFYGALNDGPQGAVLSSGDKEASQFDRGPSEKAIICKSTPSSSVEAQSQSIWQNTANYPSLNHKIPLSQSGLQDQCQTGPFQLSFPDASILMSSQLYSSVPTLQSTPLGVPRFPPSYPATPPTLPSSSENGVQLNANNYVPTECRPLRGKNMVPPPPVFSIRPVPDLDGERSSIVSILQSMAPLPPDVDDFGLPMTVNMWSGDQIAPFQQGYLFSSLLAGGCSALDQEDLAIQGPAYAEEMFPSVMLTDEDFASPSASSLSSSSVGSLQSIKINPGPEYGTSG